MSNGTVSQSGAVESADGNDRAGNYVSGNGANGKVQVRIPDTIIKRDGRTVTFDAQRIETALLRCFNSLKVQPDTPLSELTQRAVNIVAARYTVPSVEQVQDIVETVLLAAGEYDAAKHYILYRAERAKLRSQRPIPHDVRETFAASDEYFPTQLQKFQFYDKYARFSYANMRRETWLETVDRSVDFLRELSNNLLSEETYARVHDGILNMRAMPSMRLLAMAGPAARRSNITIYNCSYLPADSIDAFVEALIISMSGCGVGFSVERQYVEQFPRIRRQTGAPALHFEVPDSADGWAESLRLGLETWFQGGDVKFDFGQVRPAGAPLLTKGGRASGPEPLRKMLNFARDRILARQGSFLRPLDAHDIMCAVGNAAVSGGVRRTAMISLFDFDDNEMRHSKSGQNLVGNEQRWNANNSAVWPNRDLSQAEVTRYLLDMVESGAGEPGIFSRRSALNTLPERRQPAVFGTNPCVTRDTWVLTTRGAVQVGDLIDRPSEVLVDGRPYATTADGFFPTGRKPVYRVETVEGYSLKATADHPVLRVTKQTRAMQQTAWTNVGELESGDLIRVHDQRAAGWQGDDHGAGVAWLLGLLVGDGTFVGSEKRGNQAVLRFQGAPGEMMAEMAHSVLTTSVQPRGDHQPVWQAAAKTWQLVSTELADIAAEYGILCGQERVTAAVERASSQFYTGFLRGLFDADGSVTDGREKGPSVRLVRADLEMLQAVQRMLLRLGIASALTGGHSQSIHRPPYELVVAADNIGVFQGRVGFSEPEKAARLADGVAACMRNPGQERYVARVKSVTFVGEEDVFDCTVPGAHAFDANGLYVHNCGEIVLRPWQFCNLSVAVARPEDDLAALQDKVEVATIIGTIQSMGTHFPGLRPMWQQNCEEERLLGVDINGQMDSAPGARSGRAVQAARNRGRDQPAPCQAAGHQPVCGRHLRQTVGQLVAAARLLSGRPPSLGSLLCTQRARGCAYAGLQSAKGRRCSHGARERPDAGERDDLGCPLPGQRAGRRDHAQRPHRAGAVRILAAVQDPLDRAQPERDHHIPTP